MILSVSDLTVFRNDEKGEHEALLFSKKLRNPPIKQKSQNYLDNDRLEVLKTISESELLNGL